MNVSKVRYGMFLLGASAMLLQGCAPRVQPQTVHAISPPSKLPKLDRLKDENVVARIKKDNTIWVDDDERPTEEADLVPRLEKARRGRGATTGIVISAHKDAWHDTVVFLIDSANVAGISPIRMGVPTKIARKAPHESKSIELPPKTQKPLKVPENLATYLRIQAPPDGSRDPIVTMGDGTGEGNVIAVEEVERQVEKWVLGGRPYVIVKAEPRARYGDVQRICQSVARVNGAELYVGVQGEK